MIEFLFIGKGDFFGLLPELVCKSLNGTNNLVEKSDLRKQIIDLKNSSMTFLSLEEVETEELDDALGFLLEQVLFLVGKAEHAKKFDNIFEKHKLKIAGFMDIDSIPMVNLSLVSNAHKYLSLKLKTSEFISLGKDLNELATKTIQETNKLKDVHQQLVPIRKIECKGLNIYSKFAAGTSAGGEFFDSSTDDGILSLLVTSTSSYILTSYFLTHLSILKKSDGIQEVGTFIETVSGEVKSLGMNLSNASLLFLNIDLKKMLLKGYNFGGCSLHSSNQFAKIENTYPIDWNFKEQAYFEHQLSRKERLYILSSGMKLNAEKAGLEIKDIIQPTANKSIDDEFNEAFYQLKKNRSQKFLEHDATCVILEVLENAIFSV